MDEGFIDLRYGVERDPGGESFWPSFTDIMMVVLMIFMIASTILMLRNWDLVRELRATLLAEREAEAMALTATQTSETLEERLAQAQHEISQLRIQLLREGEQRNALNADLASARQQQMRLESDRKRLSTQLQTMGAKNTRLTDEATSLQATVDELRELELSQTEELALLRQQSTDSDAALAVLRGDYDELSVKYNKLIKPARTAAGKYLVSVRYRKEDGVYLIEFKESENDSYIFVDRDQLESQLAELKDQYAGSLYVKVIIPKDSGLSYTEAWGFTQEILTRYDYYYQD
jgi:septal ring factor EnvC (AmiA/AmiB activator)